MDQYKYYFIATTIIVGLLIIFKFVFGKIIKNTLEDNISFFLKKSLDPKFHEEDIPKTISKEDSIENLQEMLWDSFESLEKSIKIDELKTNELSIVQKIFWIGLRMKQLSKGEIK